MYALYWVCAPRSLLRTSVLINKEASDSICEEGYDWSEEFAVDRAVSDLSANSLTSPPSRLLAAASLISSSTKNVVAERGWKTFSFHAQMTGVIITITDTKHGGIAGEAHNLFSAGSPEGESEPVARVTLKRLCKRCCETKPDGTEGGRPLFTFEKTCRIETPSMERSPLTFCKRE
ncbi:hypothetical protein PsorP6_013378 [Peronosclerospora sorghi]|uniref:Uncharacterized protein n=1 Tax=Peronosclerospora sorghi TaxID=230839 RepID=A0ACC0WG33_9STRA|nr:hypothetical protein PsorP6_013378 [Peronosclerospora sorghi]